MPREINYADRQDQVDQLRNYIEEYSRENNIDPNIYIAALDGQGIDAGLRNDPAFQAYWRLAYLQLLEIIDPVSAASLHAEIGLSEENFDEIYESVDADLNQLIEDLISDSPELMAFAAQHDGDPTTNAQMVLNLIEMSGLDEEAEDGERVPVIGGPNPGPASSSGGGSSSQQGSSVQRIRNEEARRLGNELGLGGLYHTFVETEEGYRSLEASLLGALADIDQQEAEITQAFLDGRISEHEMNQELAKSQSSRGMILNMINNLEQTLATILETFSNLIKAESEMQQEVARNWGSA